MKMVYLLELSKALDDLECNGVENYSTPRFYEDDAIEVLNNIIKACKKDLQKIKEIKND